MEIKAHLTLQLKDTKTGRIIHTTHQPSRSYVRAFLDLCHVQMAQATTSIPDTGNTPRDVTTHASNLRFDAAAANDVRGTVIGTDDTAVAITDYHLGAKIVHATMNYQIQQFIAPSTVGSTRKFIATRTFVNVSGGNVTVKECGIYADGTGLGYRFCIVRDVLTTPVTVANGQSLTITYTISVTA